MDAVCVICGTNDAARELYPANVSEEDLNPRTFSARRLPDRVHEAILRCRTCGLVYPRRLIPQERLLHLYSSSTVTYEGESEAITKTYTRYLRRLMPRLQGRPRPWSYCDIGCGNGFMLPAAKVLGFDEVAGVEPGAPAIAQADPSVRPFLVQGMFSVSLLQGRQFDALSCFQTLDHIPNPVSFVADCFTGLKPGGWALFINHNIASWPARLLGEHCPMIDIAHTYLHTPHTMRTLFNRAGFREISVFSVRNDYPLQYWIYIAPGPRALKRPLLALLRRSALGRVVLPLSLGNLGLIARKPPQ